jgi:hypothetical protein
MISVNRKSLRPCLHAQGRRPRKEKSREEKGFFGRRSATRQRRHVARVVEKRKAGGVSGRYASCLSLIKMETIYQPAGTGGPTNAAKMKYAGTCKNNHRM